MDLSDILYVTNACTQGEPTPHSSGDYSDLDFHPTSKSTAQWVTLTFDLAFHSAIR